MTLTKANIIEKVSAENGWTAKQSSGYVELLIKTMKRTLASGEDVRITGFGKFQAKNKKERRGRNQATDEALILPPRKVGVRLILRSKLGKMTVNEERPEMLPAIA